MRSKTPLMKKPLSADKDQMSDSSSIESAFKGVYDTALRCLGRRAYGEMELRRKLTSMGAAMAQIDQALNRCRQFGYLDDDSFAQSFARSKMVGRHYGPRMLQAQLQEKGVASETIAAAVGQILTEVDVVDLAQEALNKKFGSLEILDPENKMEVLKAKKKRFDFLVRRGFDYDTIRKVLP
ncbi:MAG: recombination regulator RecX [Magnetococcus sp. DMHC-6]